MNRSLRASKYSSARWRRARLQHLLQLSLPPWRSNRRAFLLRRMQGIGSPLQPPSLPRRRRLPKFNLRQPSLLRRRRPSKLANSSVPCRDLRKRSRRPSLLRRVLPWSTRRRNFAPSSSVAAPNVRLFLKLSRSRKALLRRPKLRHQRALLRLPLLLLPPLPPRRPPLRPPLFLLLPPLRRAT